MKYLLHVSIGPVQEFIAEARRINDLRLGSALLSCITQYAILPFDKNAEMLIPAREVIAESSSSDYPCIPNRFLAIVSDEESLDTLVKASQEGCRAFWSKVNDEVKATLTEQGIFDSRMSTDMSLWEQWDCQVKELWQYVWVAIPISDANIANNYQTKVKEVQKALEQRKITRTFLQWEGASTIKCTQCGKREIIGTKEFWGKAGEGTDGRIRRGDRLCAVCLIKRFIKGETLEMKEPKKVESTADIAVAPYKALLGKIGEDRQESLLQCANSLLVLLGRSKVKSIDQIPGMLFFEDQLKPTRLIREFCRWDEGNKKRENEIETPAKALSQVLSDINKKYGMKLCKYYVLFGMDGDDMGKFMSEVTGKEQQGQRSHALGRLAQEMPEKVREWKWIPVYSGGDDFLAMGPLEDAVDVALKVRTKFGEILEGRTASAGMVITHYRNSLGKSLEMLRENVEKAKENDKKDSLALTVWVGSGTESTTRLKWDKTDAILPKLLQWFEEDKLSTAFAYELPAEIDAFYRGDNQGELSFDKDIFCIEVERLFVRHLKHEKDKKDKELRKEAETIFEKMAAVAKPRRVPGAFDARQNFRELLRIISFLARQQAPRKTDAQG